MGVVVQILLLPVVLLLIMTIVGIPVAIFLIPLMAVAAIILSQAAIGLFLGEKIHENTSLEFQTPLGKTLAGLMAMQSIPLLAVVFAWLAGIGVLGPSFRILSVATVALSMIVGYVVVTIGTGAVVMTRFGTRPKDPKPETAPAEGEPETGQDDKLENQATPLPRPRTDDSGTAPATG
jgi:hypothetical protein